MNKSLPVFVTRHIVPSAIIALLTITLFTSCKVYQPAYYFKDITNDTVIKGFVHTDLELKIQHHDVLAITISSLSPAEDALYNKAVAGTEGNTGFQVNTEGNIYLHKLGKLQVAGLTRNELKQRLETSLLPYLKDPIATIRFVNHRVTVLGEGGSSVVEMPEEKIALLEVMAKAGGVTQNSQLSKIMVIRESQHSKEVKHLNLEDPSIFSSPWYYLQPNDIVVVKPNQEKIDTEQRRTRNQLLYATVLSGVTFVFLIIDRVFR